MKELIQVRSEQSSWRLPCERSSKISKNCHKTSLHHLNYTCAWKYMQCCKFRTHFCTLTLNCQSIQQARECQAANFLFIRWLKTGCLALLSAWTPKYWIGQIIILDTLLVISFRRRQNCHHDVVLLCSCATNFCFHSSSSWVRRNRINSRLNFCEKTL